MEDLVGRALNFATKAHERQKRKFGDRPYIVHPIGVSEFVAMVKQSDLNKDMLIAVALLHDVVEDTEFKREDISSLFDYRVADLVAELTNDKQLANFEGKAIYLLKKMVGMSSYALVIKLADILHNLIDCDEADPEFKIKFIKRTAYIVDRIEGLRPITSSQITLLEMIRRKLKEYANND